MSDIAHIIDTYLDAYGEPDPARRRKLIEACFAANGYLADPPFDATGHDALDATFATVQGHYPGHTFRRTSDIDVHHNVARYGWEFFGPNGTVAVAGIDIARIDDDGKLATVTGFFGPLPALVA